MSFAVAQCRPQFHPIHQYSKNLRHPLSQLKTQTAVWVKKMIITYDKRVSNDARNAEAAAKLESHVNVEVGRERGADAKQQQEEVGKQDHEAPAKPTKRKMYMCI